VGPARAEPAPETGSGAAPSGPTVEALRANLQESLRAANERLAERGTSVSMAVDRTTNTVIVQVKDRDTGDTVRQIPPETALRVARNIDRLTGILVDRTA
jgi:uncharacterized FlaG/YvyC family protein